MKRSTYERLVVQYASDGEDQAYVKLVEGGDATVGHIMEDFHDALLWNAFDVLNEIVDDGPKIPKKDVGNLSKMRFHWYMWGMDNKKI